MQFIISVPKLSIHRHISSFQSMQVNGRAWAQSKHLIQGTTGRKMDGWSPAGYKVYMGKNQPDMLCDSIQHRPIISWLCPTYLVTCTKHECGEKGHAPQTLGSSKGGEGTGNHDPRTWRGVESNKIQIWQPAKWHRISTRHQNRWKIEWILITQHAENFRNASDCLD